VTAEEIRRLRTRNNWSLQDLANRSGVNKAYLSEFESGKRKLPDDVLAQLVAVLESPIAGRARPKFVYDGSGHSRLVFIDENGQETDRPAIAHLTWTEVDGTSYTMFVGERGG